MERIRYYRSPIGTALVSTSETQDGLIIHTVVFTEPGVSLATVRLPRPGALTPETRSAWKAAWRCARLAWRIAQGCWPPCLPLQYLEAPGTAQLARTALLVRDACELNAMLKDCC